MAEHRPVLGSVAELLRDAQGRRPLVSNGKSGASLEAVTIGGAPYVLKILGGPEDWALRAAGVPGGGVVEAWRRGLLDALPDCFRQPIVAVAHEDGISALLMEDVGAWLVPDHGPFPAEQQARFLDHLAALHVAYWECGAEADIVPAERRYTELSPAMAAEELGRGTRHPVPRLVADGWPLLEEVAPKAAAVVVPLVHQPAPLLDALGNTPSTFVHGNWKLDNLGTDDRGRTVLLDWELPGRGAPLSDLAWYLAINCRRLPTSKETAIALYRDALERRGVDTAPWWERQLGLCLIGALVQFGWEKALGGYDEELAWWEEQAVHAAPLLAR